MNKRTPSILATILLFTSAVALRAETQSAPEKAEANRVKEVSLVSAQTYTNPFMDVELDAVVTRPDGKQLRVPAFWAGGNDWKFRYASELTGTHTWITECNDAANTGLHGITGTIDVVPGTSDNPLYKHGPVRVSENKRHFEHADGTPFFWLADTWWKNLCQRMTWEGFQELATDRKAKGFNAVQIVCGPYPDEGFLEPRMANEGGLPYESVKFEMVNPEYFNFTDRRLQHLVDRGLAPVIVGSWGRGDCNSMQAIGLEGLKRHWRYLVARYAAYPIFWILAGEVPDDTKWNQGPWAPLATYVRELDPYHRLLTCHTGHGRRGATGDTVVIDFDMVGGNHDQNAAIQPQTVAIVSSAYSKQPPMPVLVGETCYEGHMQQGFGDTQRRMFWQSILNGAAGHTYGAAGIWHASVEGDPGCASAAFGGKKVYDWTTWKEGMNYPGATQLGMARKLLEHYPWWRFEPHPEWTAPGCYAAGIPGEVRFIYHPRGRIYDWTGTVVKNLEPGVRYAAFYFDPATGRRFDQGIIESSTGDFQTKELPSPQDWVLVLEVSDLQLSEDFNRYHGNQNATQYQSGLKVAHGGAVDGWTQTGAGALHAVDRANTAGQSNPSDWAVMMFDDNVITSGLMNANESGKIYRVEFETSAAVYASTNPEQATRAGDALLVELLRGDDTILASMTNAPGAWAGKVAFTASGFDYTGDGSGRVRLRIKPATSTGRFHGAIDSVAVRAIR